MAGKVMNVGSGRYEVRYRFTRDEMRELGGRLAAVAQEIYTTEADKKATMKQYASTLESLQTQAARLARCINEGAESREIECEVIYNCPRPGMKTLRWMDAGEGTMQLQMTPAEMQAPLDFGGESPKQPQ